MLTSVTKCSANETFRSTLLLLHKEVLLQELKLMQSSSESSGSKSGQKSLSAVRTTATYGAGDGGSEAIGRRTPSAGGGFIGGCGWHGSDDLTVSRTRIIASCSIRIVIVLCMRCILVLVCGVYESFTFHHRRRCCAAPGILLSY